MGRIILATLFFPWVVCADIGFLLHESIGNPWYPQKKIDTGFLTQGGHAAILVSDLCAESPTQVRKCHDDEPKGVVISRYDGISQENYDWIAVPESWYFYGVPAGEGKPLFATNKVFEAIAERFYSEFLFKSINRVEPNQLPPGRWRDTLAANFRRDIYNLNLKFEGNVQESILNPLMNKTNTSQFDFFLRNCSDFAADFFKDRYNHFRRTNLGDVGFTSPKGVAWSVSKLGKSLPAGDYRTIRLGQLPGSFEKSRDNLYPIENTTRHPKWALLMLYFGPQQNTLQAGFLFWSLLFKFNANTELKNTFSKEASLINYLLAEQYEAYDNNTSLISSARARGDIRAQMEALAEQSQIYKKTDLLKLALQSERDKYFGTEEEWKAIQIQLKELKTRHSVPSNVYDLLEQKGEVHWAGKSLVISYDKRRLVIAGEGLGEGDRDLLRWIRISRLDNFVNNDRKNRPEIALAREELRLIKEL